MTTLAQLADECQAAINDTAAGTWSQATVEQWVVAGIRVYSQSFPRQIITTIATTTDDHKYDLPADFQAILAVEYPTDDNPPVYLKRKSHTDPRFWVTEGYYDILPGGSEPGLGTGFYDQIWISTNPATSETIRIFYTGDQDIVLAAGDTVSVPARHFHIIINYVIWQAWRERTATEEKDPETTTLQLSQFQANENAARKAFDDSISNAIPPINTGGYSGPWAMDSHDRIY